MKRALVTGITGQTGSYLTEILLGQNYSVDGLVRRLSTPNMKNIQHLLSNPNLKLIPGDVEDATRISGIIKDGQYDTVYNFAGMSLVSYSFDNPVQTALTNYIGVLNIVEAIKHHSSHTKVYQASTSELFGGISNLPNTEYTPFVPRSPYAVSKLASYWTIVNARLGYGIFACNGLLHNHESRRRGIEFVTQKVVTSAAKYSQSLEWGTQYDILQVGNLEAKRDWGHALDYARGANLIMEHDKPDDYVLATGEAHSVRELIELAYGMAGVSIRWVGTGRNEMGFDKEDGRAIVEVSPEFYRPTEVNILIGDPSKAEQVLGWKREYNFVSLIKDMYRAAIDNL